MSPSSDQKKMASNRFGLRIFGQLFCRAKSLRLAFFGVFAIGFFTFALLGVSSAEPAKSSREKLTIQWQDQTQFLTGESFKKMGFVETFKSLVDPAYRGAVIFRGIPMHRLLESSKIDSDSVVVFQAEDGFSAHLPAKILLTKDDTGPIAYLAVESLGSPWPSLKKSNAKSGDSSPSAGPYYLIWKNAEKGAISPEQWPFQVVKIEVKPSIEKQFPAMVPKTADWSILKGFQVFQKNCLVCHTFNSQGSAQMGPDLNIPRSPVEYLNEHYLRDWIRNNQSVRQFKQGKMPAFDKTALPEEDLENLIKYFWFMAKNRS